MIMIIAIIIIILVIFFIWIYVINKHGNLKFWKVINKNPEEALKLIIDSDSWYIDYAEIGDLSHEEWDGPFLLKMPSNNILHIYGKIGKYEKSQKEILKILKISI